MATTDKRRTGPPAILTRAVPRIRAAAAWARREHVGLSTPED